jgi:hypothetical protein
MTMAMGQLLRVTTGSANGSPERIVHYIVAEPDFEKAAALLQPTVSAGAKIESSGMVSVALLKTLKLAPGQFTEV